MPETRYYRWEGDACRVHEHPNGDLTADIYRAGIGCVAADASDVIDCGIRIPLSEYDEMVQSCEARRQSWRD